MLSTRDKFVKEFGEVDAALVEKSAKGHRVDEDDNFFKTIGERFAGKQNVSAPDMFLLDISTCISWDCFTKYRESHGFSFSEKQIMEWVRKNAVPPVMYRDPVGEQAYKTFLGE